MLVASPLAMVRGVAWSAAASSACRGTARAVQRQQRGCLHTVAALTRTSVPWAPSPTAPRCNTLSAGLATAVHRLSDTKAAARPISGRCYMHRTMANGTRTFLSLLPGASGATEPQEHHERRLVQWSPDLLYEVVQDVGSYKDFLPWCVDSRIIRQTSPTQFDADLTVGFRMVSERYRSRVTLVPKRHITSVSTGTHVLKHLTNTWHFEPGPDPGTCWLSFSVEFSFRSPLYSQVSSLFMDEVIRKMVAAYEARAATVQQQRNQSRAHAAARKAPATVTSRASPVPTHAAQEVPAAHGTEYSQRRGDSLSRREARHTATTGSSPRPRPPAAQQQHQQQPSKQPKRVPVVPRNASLW